MNGLILGNIFSFLSAVCIAASVIKKNKKHLVKWQIWDEVFCVFAHIAFGAWAALTTNSLSLFRNILSYRRKLNKRRAYWLLVLNIVIGLAVNNLGYIGWMPILATSTYTYYMYKTKNDQGMRYALILNLSLWFVHDLYIMAYPSAIMDVGLVIWTFVQALKRMKQNKRALSAA